MRNLFLYTAVIGMVFFSAMHLDAGSKKLGEACIGDAECEFNTECKSGVCVKKSAFDTGSNKSGKPCNIDADCIMGGKCADNGFGKKVCTGQ